MTDDEILATIKGIFPDLDTLTKFLGSGKLVLDRSYREAELANLRASQTADFASQEAVINAKIAENEEALRLLRNDQSAQAASWQAQIDAKQAELDAINAIINGGA